METRSKKVMFIVNKFAGTGYQPAVEGKMIEVSERHDVECTIEFTRSPGHATELAQAAVKEHFDAVVAVGGDGTINEVARGLVRSSVPMGIIPRGSGNGLSRHLGIPLKLHDAINAVFRSSPVAVDTFTVNDKLSLNVSGIGFDGHIANLFGGKTKRGLTGYTKLTISEFLQFKEFDASVLVDGNPVDAHAFIIAVANSSQYGNNARIAPAASVCDGLLHLNIIRKVPMYRLDVVYAVFAGNIERSSFCQIVAGQKITIKTTKPIAYHVDGEPCGHHDNFQITINPSSLKVLVPDQSPRKHKI
ncbi:diacylglycerol/lipid kinase family protein [Pseudochryseolinea flava]|uniref:diacylglycerol/lipid kinase family protein n=1 Tax=Pseudochryseolinea flava TaxID=2059302 RepID=UPI001057BA8E|nr:diacylglycerol kinase family protein [Pseudochryseolinea flava]